MRTLQGIAIVLFLGAAGISVAAPVLDQSFDFAPSAEGTIRSDIDRAQTFTVGITGQLTSIDLRLRRFDSSTTAPLQVAILGTSGGVPSSSVLASTTISASSLPIGSTFNAPFFSIDLSSQDLHVSEDDVLAIALFANTGNVTGYEWMSNNTGGYSGGSEFIRNPGGPWNTGTLNDDFAFQTYVEMDCLIPVDLLLQYHPDWRSDLLGRSTKTIGAKGCALTSLSMALNQAGVNSFSLTPTLIVQNNPGFFNKVLQDYGWGFAGRSAGLIFGDATSTARVASGQDVRFVRRVSSSRSTLETLVCDEQHPVIVGVNLDARDRPGHYVVVYGMEAGKFLIRDPGHGKQFLEDYPTRFQTRGYVENLAPSSPLSDDEPAASLLFDLSQINLGVVGVVDTFAVRIVSPTGQISGLDETTGEWLQGIDGGGFFIDAISDAETGEPATEELQTLQIDCPPAGQYKVQIKGLGIDATDFILQVANYRTDGTRFAVEVLGSVSPAGVFEYTFDFNPVPESSTRVLTILSVMALSGWRRSVQYGKRLPGVVIATHS